MASSNDAEVRRLLQEILERPRYKNFRPESFDLWRRVLAWFDWLFEVLPTLYEENPLLYWLLVSCLVTLCVLMIRSVIRSLSAAMAAQPDRAPEQGSAPERDMLREARALAERGEFLEAAHVALLASLRELARSRHIPLAPEDSNRAVCRQLMQSKLPSALRDQLIALIVQTERAWFGAARHSDTRPYELYQQWLHAYEQLRSAVPGP